MFNKAIRVLLFANFLVLIAGAMLGPIYALFVERVGGDLLDASVTGGIFAVAAGITTLIAGMYTDRIRSPHKVLLVAYILLGIGYLLYAFVYSVWTLFLVQILLGMGAAIGWPAFDALYSTHLDHHKEGSEWAAWEAMDYFTTAAGAFAGGIIVTWLGFNTLFFIMAGFCFVSAVYLEFVSKALY